VRVERNGSIIDVRTDKRAGGPRWNVGTADKAESAAKQLEELAARATTGTEVTVTWSEEDGAIAVRENGKKVLTLPRPSGQGVAPEDADPTKAAAALAEMLSEGPG
jgi:hypothetical protein